ncbi:helicase C-terminal domain-containing protein [Campylobacter canis]
MQDNKFCICEMPTAFGKSLSALMLAKKIIEEKEAKRVVIVTSNNLLAKNLFLESQKIPDLPSCILGIGKENYLDEEKLKLFLEEGELKKDILPYSDQEIKESLKKLKNGFPYILVDDFADDLNITDSESINYIQKNLSPSKSNYQEFTNYDIHITNYAFIISCVLFQHHDIEHEDVVYIFDEVQDLIRSAELVLSSKFSLYSYYLQLRTIREEFLNKKDTPKSILNLISDEIEKIRVVNDVMKDEKMAGKAILDGAVSVLKSINVNNRLFSQEKHKTLEAKLRRMYKKHPSSKLNTFLNQIADAKATLAAQDVYLTYSRERGYLSFHTYSKDINLKLANKLWDKIPRFVGITATALISKDPQELVAYKRIGINFNDINLPEHTIREKKSKLAIIKTFKGILKPEQASYNLTNQPFIEDEDKRFDFFAKEILKNYDNKNTMVLVGGFSEVKLLSEKLSSVKEKLVLAEPNKSVTNTIKEFKERGGIFIATRNYGTGLNLQGKELERLFITKLPYPVYQDKKWLNLKHKNSDFFWFEYNNEMIINFRQAIGRLIRTPNDTGKIFILDGKINSIGKGLKEKIVFFLDKVAAQEALY